MDIYLAALFEGDLLVNPWILVAAWVVLFTATHLVARSARKALRMQKSIVVAENRLLNRALEPKYIAVQFLFGVFVFVPALYFGGSFCAFFGGGLVVGNAVALGLNYHGLMFARALGHHNSARGQTELSAWFSFLSSGHRLLGAALACLLAGLALANLPLLGGALFLGSPGVGYLRRAHSVHVQP